MARNQAEISLVKTLAFVALAGWGAQAHSNCYSLYNARQVLISRTVQPPVDVSRPYRDALAAQYPGHQLVVTGLEHCATTVTPGALTGAGPSAFGGFPEGSWLAQIRDLNEFAGANFGSVPVSDGAAATAPRRESGTDGVGGYTRDDGATPDRPRPRAAPGTPAGR